MLSIVRAELADAEEVLSLQKLSYQSEAMLYNDWTLPPLTQTLSSLQDEFQHSVVLKAVINNQLVGSVRANVDQGVCRIGRLIVHPEFQRRGIGSDLLTQIENQFPCVVRYELFTGNKSVGNIRLYERQGYVFSHNQSVSDNLSLVFLMKTL